jgi:hypothetical protein
LFVQDVIQDSRFSGEPSSQLAQQSLVAPLLCAVEHKILVSIY